MMSWIHIFSHFTDEALLFEAFGISILIASYCLFWLLKKRRLGVAHTVMPSGLVKLYLNDLISDAESLRAQLFGLLKGATGGDGKRLGAMIDPEFLAKLQAAIPSAPAATPSPNFNPSVPGAIDPALLGLSPTPSGGGDKMMEAKLAEKEAVIKAVTIDKERLEKELATAKAGAAPGASSDGEMVKLREKISNLEGKLAEYSVIEDDLANLKRLQQENNQLKTTLEKQGIAASAGSTAPSPDAKPAEPAPAAAAAEKPKDAFEGLASTVGESLQAAPAAAAAKPAEPALAAPAAPAATPVAGASTPAAPAAPASGGGTATPLEPPSTSGPPTANLEKNDADLVAEFEKMLNS